jgi:hypothetical protein
VVAGSALTAGGAIAIGMAGIPRAEQEQWKRAVVREGQRYGFDPERAESQLHGQAGSMDKELFHREWWELLIAASACGLLVWLGLMVRTQPVQIDPLWMLLLITATLVVLAVGAIALWRGTRFS